MGAPGAPPLRRRRSQPKPRPVFRWRWRLHPPVTPPGQLTAVMGLTLVLCVVVPWAQAVLGWLSLVTLVPTGLVAGLFLGYGAMTMGLPHLANRLLVPSAALLVAFCAVLCGADPLAWRGPGLVSVGLLCLIPILPWGRLVAGWWLGATLTGWWFSPGNTLLEVAGSEAVMLLPLSAVAVVRWFHTRQPMAEHTVQDPHQDGAALVGTLEEQVADYKAALRRAHDVQGLYRVLIDMLDSLIGKSAPETVGKRLVRTAAHAIGADDVFLFIRFQDPVSDQTRHVGWRFATARGEVTDHPVPPTSGLRNLLNQPFQRRWVDDPIAAKLPVELLDHRLVLLEPFHSPDVHLNGFYALGWRQPTKPSSEERQMIAHLAVLTATGLESTLLRGRLSVEARTDGLTGLLNRRAFLSVAQRELLLAERTGAPVSVCALDVDHFKNVNDTHGHATGDDVLARVGRVMRETLRTTDLLGRLGGEEFMALLPNTPLENARVMAERMRERLAAETFTGEDGAAFAITASFGVATRGKDQELAALMADADRALYDAKQSGRNRVVVAEGAPAPEDSQTVRR